MVGALSTTFLISLHEINQLTPSDRFFSLFYLSPVGIHPSLNVRDRFLLHYRFKQVAEPALELEIIFNRLELGHVGVHHFPVDGLLERPEPALYRQPRHIRCIGWIEQPAGGAGR